MSNPEFNPTCPQGGQWYACGNGAKFVGCCASDPCSDAGCSIGNTRYTSFDPAYYATEALPDQQCASSGASWYTCTGTSPAFMGCCTSNPCTNATGCPQQDLIQGVLSSADAAAQRMDPQPPLGSTDNGSSSVSTGVIVGAVIGGCAVLVIAVALIWWARRRKNHKNQPVAQHPNNGPVSPHLHEKNNFYQDSPSTMPAYSPAPSYGFQQPHPHSIIHEADAGNQTDPGYGPLPRSPPTNNQRYSSTISNTSNSPQIGTMSSYNNYARPPSELAGNDLKGLGVRHLSPPSQDPVELGDSSHPPLKADTTEEHNPS